MLVVFISLTGQTRKFVKKLAWPSIELTPDMSMPEINEPFIIIAPTYDREVTDILWEFVEKGNNVTFFKGVAGSGNLNFNTLYCFTAKDISRDFNVPILLMFEFQGRNDDVQKLKDEVEKLG